MKTATLPDKLSDLLELAIDDVAKCSRDSRYEIDMGMWHQPQSNGSCLVCMAGAVMAKTMEVPVGTYSSPGCYYLNEAEKWRKLGAINSIRTGRFGFIEIGIGLIAVNLMRDQYEKQNLKRLQHFPKDKAARRKWYAAWRKFAQYLRSEGL